MKTSLKIVGGIVAGAAVGALTGLLLAPDSGKKTRKKIADESDKLKGFVQSAVDEKLKEAKGVYKNMEEKYVSNGKKIAEKVNS